MTRMESNEMTLKCLCWNDIISQPILICPIIKMKEMRITHSRNYNHLHQQLHFMCRPEREEWLIRIVIYVGCTNQKWKIQEFFIFLFLVLLVTVKMFILFLNGPFKYQPLINYAILFQKSVIQISESALVPLMRLNLLFRSPSAVSIICCLFYSDS